MPTTQVAYDQIQATLYDKYAIDNQYELAEGVFALPVAEEPPTDAEALKVWSPVQVVRAHSPYRVRRVTMDVEKKQTPPVLPKPADTGAFTFLGGAVSMPAPMVGGDFSNFNWKAKAEYVFVESAASDPKDGLVLGMTPWTYTTQDDNAEVYGGIVSATGGAALRGGLGVQMGVAQADGVDFTQSYWYNTPQLWPGIFWNNDQLLNGGPPVGVGG